MAKLINSFLKKQTFRQIFPIFARENKDILSKYRLNTNETNHTHHRRSTFRQKHLCGKAGTRALSHSRLSCHGTHLGRIIPPEGNPASGTPGTGMDKHRRGERTQPPPAGGAGRPDRLHHLMVYQLFLRPAFRYRPGTCHSKGRVRPLHGTRRNLHLCNQ